MSVEGWEPGDRIQWHHFYPGGHSEIRAGTIWDRAPGVDGAVVVAWVVPDTHEPTDLYYAIAVGKSSRRDNAVHGWYPGECSEFQYVNKGMAFASNYAGSPTGQLAVIAARAAHRVRERAA